MKMIRTIAVLSMIVLFPAISYYYLSSGFNYRKEVLESLKPKGTYSDWSNTHGLNIPLDSDEKNRVSLLVVRGGEEMDDKYTQLIEQFEGTENFQILFVNGDNMGDFKLGESSNAGAFVHNHQKDVKLEMDMLLIDHNGMVRSDYQATDDDFKLLIRDIASILPKKKEKDIKVKKPQNG